MSKTEAETKQPKSWRDILPVHPAADDTAIPLLDSDQRRELAKDIKANGLKISIVVWTDSLGSTFQLLDGRNRLDAMEEAGLLKFDGADSTREGQLEFLGQFEEQFGGKLEILYGDNKDTFGGSREKNPAAYVASVNVRRRHLTAEQKREIIGKLLKVNPGKSDREIGRTVQADGKTVATVRHELEATAEIPQLDKRAGKDGKSRKQPAKKAKAQPAESVTVKLTERTEQIAAPYAVTSAPKSAPGQQVITAEERMAQFAAEDEQQTPAKPVVIDKPSSWQIIAITKDGQRWANGVRLATEAEADVYRMTHVVNNFWEEFKNDKKLKEPQHVFVGTEAIPTNDEPNVSVHRDSKGKLKAQVGFEHGTCHLFGWNPIAAGSVLATAA
jgi:hypothetical protein